MLAHVAGSTGRPMKKKRINSRAKGKVGERAWASLCTNEGYPAYRTAQVAGNFNANNEGVADVACDSLPDMHFEVKVGACPHPWNALAQAERDAATGKFPIAALRKDRHKFIVAMSADTYFRMVRGDHL